MVMVMATRDKEITFMRQGTRVTEAKLLGKLRAAVEAYEEFDEHGIIVEGSDVFEVYEDPGVPGVYAIGHKFSFTEKGDEPIDEASIETVSNQLLTTPLSGDEDVARIARGLCEVEFQSWPPQQTGEKVTSFAYVM